MLRKYHPYLLLLILVSSALGANGKLAGRVTAAESGEPLPGVNVLVEGTSLGAATDINGEYVILNVPPATYTLRASYIGYSTQKIENLRVSTGQTTRQDFSLPASVLEGEEIIVVAQRPLVQGDLTATQRITTSEEIAVMPVETFMGVLTTQAGVNLGADGSLHIRGGRYNEVGFYIDGISVSNPFFTNTLAISLSNKALEEMKVVSGAFTAEYGDAMSGIVNLQVKEGGPDYHGSFAAYSGDYLSSDNTVFPNIDDLNPFANRVLEGTLNGPLPFFFSDGRLTFNITGRYSSNKGYLYGIQEHLPGDSADFRDSDNWYIELGGDSSYVPMNWSRGLSLLGKFSYRVNPRLKITAQLMHSGGKQKSYVHAYKYNPDGTTTYQSANNNYSIKINHALGSRSFYEGHLFFSTTDYQQYQFRPVDLSAAIPADDAERFGYQDYVLYTEDADGNRTYTLQNSAYAPTSRIRGAPPSATFAFGGSQQGQAYRRSQSGGFKLDYTSQVTLRHEVKTGINFRTDRLDERNFTILYNDQEYRVPTILPANQSPQHNHYDKTTLFFSTYLQDKIEYPNFITNLGLRYDYFDPNSEYLDSLLVPDSKYIDSLLIPGGERSPASPKHMLSPRLGVSFPITDRGILHFSYGHFYQMPTLRRLYLESIFGAGQHPTVGYADLRPEKTVLYEFGLQQQLTGVLALEASAFYKDIRDLLAVQSIRYDSRIYGPSSYTVYMNKDYGNVKGFTFTLTKRYDPLTRLSAFLDYTFQVTEGNSVTSGSFYYNALTGEEEEKRIVPLSWDQRHILNTTVSIGDPRNWSLALISKLGSGWPYSPNIPYVNYNPDPNSGRKPWQWKVDLRFHKNIRIAKLNYTVFVKLYNLLDRRNERYVFDDTGRAGYTYVFQSTQETAEFKRHYGEPGVHTWSEYQLRPYYYTAPRQVNIGVSLDF